jgi:hypothetical protein
MIAESPAGVPVMTAQWPGPAQGPPLTRMGPEAFLNGPVGELARATPTA